MVYLNIYTNSLGWHGWICISGGLTDQGPAVSISDELIVMVKGTGGDLWVNIKSLDGSWLGWTNIQGVTLKQPELLSLF